jgi:nucleoside triphosphate pyrophosphatase
MIMASPSLPTANEKQLVLASASPRRQEFLKRLGYDFFAVPSRIDETALPNETPEAHVIRLSREKALEVAGRRDQTGRFFLGSDTIVLCDHCILGKPANPAEATSMLRQLSARHHQVISGYAIHDRLQGKTRTGLVATRVTFRQLTEEEIAGYIASGEPFDKAGSYAIQGGAAVFVTAIEGSYTNVVGLPLAEVVETLVAMGLPRPFTTATAPEGELKTT